MPASCSEAGLAGAGGTADAPEPGCARFASTVAKPGVAARLETSSTTKSCAMRLAPMPGCVVKVMRPSAAESKSAHEESGVVADGVSAVPGGGGAWKGTVERKPLSRKALVTHERWKLSTSAAVGRPGAAESGRPGTNTSVESLLAALDVLRGVGPKPEPMSTAGSRPSVLDMGMPPAAPPGDVPIVICATFGGA